MTDRTGSAFSSEELIEQARDEAAGKTREPASQLEAGKAEHRAQGEEAPTGGGAMTVREPRKPEETVPPGDPFGLPEREPRSGTGDRFDPAPSAPPPAAPGRGATIVRFRGAIILIVLLLGGAIWAVLDNTKSVEDLAVGDCIEEPSGELIQSVETIECSEPHDYEVFAVVELAASDGAPYPGDETIAFDVYDRCLAEFEGYVGRAFEDSILWIDTLSPSADSWSDGDRAGDCLLAEYDSLGRIVPLTGSSRNSGR